ncbi:J domain-containing protein [Aphelenchoides fujianensis]|nr:J domain-containing protein [Aphelenchoides fujianensis]
MSSFEDFYTDLKKTENDDSKLTSDQQITRLLRPGSTYLNLNPFEVLQLEPECDLEQARKKYKRLSILVHPDKNPDDRERADKAFDILKKALATLEDPDELSRCRDVYVEGRARLAIVMSEKKRKLRREGKDDKIEEDTPDGYKKALWVTVTKVFADREKKRRALEERANEEKRRIADEIQKAAEKRKLEEEYKANYEETRDVRRGSWRDFVKKKEKKLATYQGANFRPVVGNLETSKEASKRTTTNLK